MCCARDDPWACVPSRWQSSTCSNAYLLPLLWAGVLPPFLALPARSPLGLEFLTECQPTLWGWRDSSLLLSVSLPQELESQSFTKESTGEARCWGRCFSNFLLHENLSDSNGYSDLLSTICQHYCKCFYLYKLPPQHPRKKVSCFHHFQDEKMQ